jgi:hypothetical protein
VEQSASVVSFMEKRLRHKGLGLLKKQTYPGAINKKKDPLETNGPFMPKPETSSGTTAKSSTAIKTTLRAGKT